MKKTLILLLPLLLGYFITLLLMLPARFALGWLSLPAALQLEEIDGTLWQGEVQNVVWNKRQTGPLSWSWRSSALLRGDIAADIGIADPRGIRGSGVVAWNGDWNIDDARLHLPAALSGELLGLAVGLGGDVNATLTQLRFTARGCIAARADLTWTQGSVETLAGRLNTGDTQVRLKCINQQWRADITQRSPQVNSKGQFTLTGGGDYRWQSEVTPGADFPSALLNLLNPGARHQTNGQFTVDTAGRL
ncbi:MULTISPECIES: type II secretion system protein N [unclassified Leclercia]|uniref:Type II secretion system protein N n=1 Tax=Leclercia barmai TaxID=2785629 RepID=A0ABS7RZ21_9ENTR|nr:MULTISPECIES: type II secretion system protein N [unclassified Leclercia]MBZ0059564.1 type II secretion system protein N [Leclercia sp. EMC7]MCM5697303.1 type II secretion system protein N [Leclercia sp. LTM01]MCM5702100.1 type II secretion system protein N [Leclercia sp. LTM14]